MPLFTAEALVLRTYKLGEADRIVVFLTRDRGKKRGVAPNARKSRKRFGAALEALCCGTQIDALARYFECWLLRLQGVTPEAASLSLGARTFLDGARKVAPRDVATLGASVPVLREIELFHRKLISMHLEREPRSVRVLNAMRRS